MRVLSHRTCGVDQLTGGRTVSRKTWLVNFETRDLDSFRREISEHETVIHLIGGHGDGF